MMTARKAKLALKEAADPVFKETIQGFFKCEKGQYSEGDIFIGVSKPKIKQIAKFFRLLTLDQLKILLNSKIHEERVLALEILNQQFLRAECDEQSRIFKFYIRCMHRVNNWDLVDQSAPVIVGGYLFQREKTLLYKWAESPTMWVRRIAIVSTLYFIRQGKTQDALKLSQKLLGDCHDLMHKAVGWMLREVGKQDEARLRTFLEKHKKRLPRTTLRYAIERFSRSDRVQFLG